MNINWLKVIVAAFFEVFWVIGLKHADHFWAWVGTTLAIIISFYLMIMAAKELPVSTVYAVFVGLGTVGTIFTDIIFFGATFSIAKLLLISILLMGVVGLKLVSVTKEGAES
ncbi:DMT family transporter [Pseudogracilibacillus auburnensis]|uniref:Paired small multidrug resistance pump n=1 Tax=Pseudogracilibacillus auburnensis TaxID=1494959 RepID=A0A2V3W9I6_9BACI|nr:multidrug efflux SMR transporter [Pseudogracilibacillus auburnensis]PXW90186.1 paired small multidrug resistance pump [Pseudogracilibacillus auburnensis]